MTNTKCYVCDKELGKDISDLFGGLCFEHAMEMKSLKERYLKLSGIIEKCYGCNYFGQVFNTNMILGATIETDDYTVLQEISKAPDPFHRLIAIAQLRDRHPEYRLFVSIEPIMKFFKHFAIMELLPLKLWGVAVGYDNYNNKLVEPTLAETEQLIKELEGNGVNMYRKTIREKWDV